MFWKSSPSSRMTLLDQGIISGTNLLLGLLLIRWGSLDMYGNYVLFFLGITLANSLQYALILTPMSTIGPKKHIAELKPYLSSTGSLQVGFTLVSFVATLGWLLVNVLMGKEAPLALLGLMGSYLFHEYGRRIFFVQDEAEKVLRMDVIAYGAIICLIGGMAFMGRLTMNGIFGMMAIAYGLSSLWALRNGVEMTLSISGFKSTFKLHWHVAKWLTGAELLQFFSTNFFIILGGTMLGEAAVGAVRIVQSLMGGLHLLFISMENIVPIKAAKALASDGLSGLMKYLRAATLKMGLLTGAMLLVLAFAGQAILVLVYGPAAETAEGLMVPFCGLYVLIFLGYPLRYVLLSLENTQPIMWAYALNIAFSMLAASYFLHHWGIMGIVAGMMVAQVIKQGTYAVGGWISFKKASRMVQPSI